MKKLFSLAALLLTVLLLAACGPTPLPDGVTQEALTQKATDVMDLLNAQDYEALTLQFKEEYQPQLTEESWHEAMDASFSEMGAFTEYKNIQTMGQKAQDSDEVYAVAVVLCSYENGEMTFTLTFESDLTLIGLFRVK